MITSKNEKVRIAALAGYAGDRIDSAVEVLRNGNVKYGVFECLAERTIALAQKDKKEKKEKGQEGGYDPLLTQRMKEIMPIIRAKGIKIITNMGAANVQVAGEIVKRISSESSDRSMKVAIVFGDDIFDKLGKYGSKKTDAKGLDRERLTVQELPNKISANAYLGKEGILKALKEGAEIVVTGRVADPSLFLAPIMYELGWNGNNYKLIGKGLVAGHLLECAAQVTGGYYADPGYKDVPDLWRVGFPIAEVSRDGTVVITKTSGSGGLVTKATCTEQLLYEIDNPARYITADGIANFSKVTFKEVGPDTVQVDGATAAKKTNSLKVSIGYVECYMGEGEISYGGSTALTRARLAGDIVVKRLKYYNVPIIGEPKVDIIGVNSLYGDSIANSISKPENTSEVRLRVAAKTPTREAAKQIGNEVEALYTNGPAGGGGARKGDTEIVAIASILVPRKDVPVSHKFIE